MLQHMRDRGPRLLVQPIRALPTLLVVALGVEGAQYVTEVFPGAHALGEVVRNLAYALMGAVIFHWLVVQIPSRRRQRATYAYNAMNFKVLLIAGPGLLWRYQELAKQLNMELDVWDEASISRVAEYVNSVAPDAFGSDRAGLLTSVVELAVPRALADLSRSTAYLDEDVAHALAQFPMQDGLTMLQVRRTPSGGIEPKQDVHITWSLLDAARRLFPLLLQSGAYDSSIYEGYAGEPPVRLQLDVLLKEKTSD